MEENMDKEALSGANKKQKKMTWVDRGLFALAAVLFIAGGWMLFRQFVYLPESYVAPATPAPLAPTPAPTAAVGTPAPTPSPTPYVQKLPVHLHFTDREISCPIESVGLIENVDKDGEPILDAAGNVTYAMGTIDSEKVSAWLSTGPSPGEPGNAILNGHVRWKKVAGVFSILPEMQVGERMAVTYNDGSVSYWAVDSIDFFTIDDWPAWVMDPNSGDTRMTLISCYGAWNSEAGTANERVIVVAKPTE
jgi:LPXTG-site transpeptidase (sortase) family protein